MTEFQDFGKAINVKLQDLKIVSEYDQEIPQSQTADKYFLNMYRK